MDFLDPIDADAYRWTPDALAKYVTLTYTRGETVLGRVERSGPVWRATRGIAVGPVESDDFTSAGAALAWVEALKL